MRDRLAAMWAGTFMVGIFSPVADVIRHALLPKGGFYAPYSTVSCPIEFAIMALVGFLTAGFLASAQPRWRRYVSAFTFFGAAVVAITVFRLAIEHKLFGHALDSSSFPAIMGTCCGFQLCKDHMQARSSGR